jgi:putative photosynthetic complex assembly protein 2
MMVFAAIAYVVVLWALSTAVIFYLDSLAPHTFPWSMGAATLVLAASFYVMWRVQFDVATLGIGASFAAGLLAWGWTEMALYMGYVTGPRKHRCAEGCSGAKHFGHAISANLWHELVIILFACLIWFSGNATALWCFVMLWVMHLSARLNVFLGVRNVSAEFVPEHMDVLKGFLRKRNMNPLFPISCLVLAGLTVYLVMQEQTFALTMATTLAAIGLLEHIILMLPLPVERMWHWSLSRQQHHKADDSAPQKTSRHLRHPAVGAIP